MRLTIPSSIAEVIDITVPKDGPSLNGGHADAADAADDNRPILIVDSGDLPKVATQLRDIIAGSSEYFDRGGPARLTLQANETVPTVVRLNSHGVVRAAHFAVLLKSRRMALRNS
jgi:hypothetical protein